MAREKKINIRYYLNKNLKHLQVGEDVQYKLYVRVTYDRMNTAFLFFVPGYGYLTEEQFHDFFVKRTNPVINEQVEKFEDALSCCSSYLANADVGEYKSL